MEESPGYSTYTPSGGLMGQVKAIFPPNCCTIFGVFNRYLAPAYHHDRCERSVQMTLYTMQKRDFVFTFVGLFVSLLLMTFIGLVGPPITWTSTLKASSLNVTDMAKGPFNLKSPSLNTYHQQLWLIARVQNENKDRVESFEKNFEMEVQIFGIRSGHPHRLFDDPVARRSRLLQCHLHEIISDCNPLTLLHLPHIDFPSYLVLLTLSDLDGIHRKYNITDISFYFKTYNPQFTQLEMSFRFIFGVCTFGATCLFMYTLRRFSVSDWSIEQKGIAILLPMLFLYNNPAFPLMFLMSSTFPHMLDAIFQVTFFSALLLFWLVIYHGLRQVERRILLFYLPKVVLVGGLWASALVLASWQLLSSTRDPTYDYTIDTFNYYNLRTFFLVCGVTYLLYLLFLVITAYSELRTMPYFDVRLKFLTGLMLFVLKSIVMLTYMRFGMDIVEDHFVMDLQTRYGSSVEFMIFYGVLNLYVWTMAYVYSPSSSAFVNPSSQITKDNPSFSMINDSEDEEVIFGGEESEDTKPLNLNSVSTTHNHHDDSD